MIDVNVSVSGIIMCCDESLCGLTLGNGYTIKKCDLNSLPFKDKITDALLKMKMFFSYVFKKMTLYRLMAPASTLLNL